MLSGFPSFSFAERLSSFRNECGIKLSNFHVQPTAPFFASFSSNWLFQMMYTFSQPPPPTRTFGNLLSILIALNLYAIILLLCRKAYNLYDFPVEKKSSQGKLPDRVYFVKLSSNPRFQYAYARTATLEWMCCACKSFSEHLQMHRHQLLFAKTLFWCQKSFHYTTIRCIKIRRAFLIIQAKLGSCLKLAAAG